MKFRINNVLIDVSYSYQTKLEELSEDEALKLVEKVIINGREGFFCIKSNVATAHPTAAELRGMTCRRFTTQFSI